MPEYHVNEFFDDLPDDFYRSADRSTRAPAEIETNNQSLYWDNAFVKYHSTLPENQIKLFEEKNSWIYLYGSPHLQQSTSLGYSCEDKYFQERIALEYPGFMWHGKSITADLFVKVDTPSPDAIAQVIYWDNAYIGRGIPLGFDCGTTAEVIVIPNYLGKYTIIKEIKPSAKHFISSIDLRTRQIDPKHLSGFIAGVIVCAVAIFITQASGVQLGFFITMASLLFYGVHLFD
jgi:small basic protein